VKKGFIFPIRFKILIAVLCVVSVAVGVITVSMAKMFHTDKTNYIRDLTSIIAMNMAQEGQSLLTSYQERLQVFARIMVDTNMPQGQKRNILTQMFEDFQDFTAITIYPVNRDPVTIYDSQSLKEAGLSSDTLAKYREKNPLPLDTIRSGARYVENSTIDEKMPSLTLAIAQQTEHTDTVVVSGVIRLDELLRLAKRSSVFETFMVDANGAVLTHSDIRKVVEKAKLDWLPELRGVRQGQSMGTTLEYTQSGVEMVGGFSALRSHGLLAGAQIPKTAAYLTAQELLDSLVGVSFLLLLVASILGLVWSRRLTKPLEKLSAAAAVLAKGDFSVKVENKSGDEIGELANSFNHMADELSARDRELRHAQAALIQSEKMSAFGQISAGIAHEVKNPLSGILGYAQLSQRKLEPDSPVRKNLERIEKETKRCKDIIENLMQFARQEKAELEPTNLNEVLKHSIDIVDHQLTINGVQIKSNLEENIPQVLGNANQLQQVIMNFMINAQQALDGTPGEVVVTSRKLNDQTVEILVSDNGPGIPKEIQANIFEPFFTTKPAGKGTGLGLSVTYGIIKDHKGEIRLESEPDEGATFIITLPIPSATELAKYKKLAASKPIPTEPVSLYEEPVSRHQPTPSELNALYGEKVTAFRNPESKFAQTKTRSESASLKENKSASSKSEKKSSTLSPDKVRKLERLLAPERRHKLEKELGVEKIAKLEKKLRAAKLKMRELQRRDGTA